MRAGHHLVVQPHLQLHLGECEPPLLPACLLSGYYARFAALRQLILQYLDAQAAAGEASQVTRAWQVFEHKLTRGTPGGPLFTRCAPWRAEDVGAQVLVLGAGFDTTWFQLATAGRAPTRTLELDFAQVRRR